MYSFLRGAQRDKSRRYRMPTLLRQRHRQQQQQQQQQPPQPTEPEAGHGCRHDDTGCQRVSINVSGELFETQLRTLERFPGTLLGTEEKRLPHWDSTRGQYFFDRHRPSFAAILNYYQTGGRLRRPAEVPEEIFYEELKFFQIDDAAIRGFLVSEGYSPLTVRQWARPSWRTALFSALHYPKASRLGRCLAAPSVAVIVLSVALHCLHSMPPCFDNGPTGGGGGGGGGDTGETRQEHQRHHRDDEEARRWRGLWFGRLEFACIAWFAVEFCVKLTVCPVPRARLLSSAPVWLDAVSFAPFFVSACLEAAGIASVCESYLMRALHFSHVLRVLKLYRYVTGMQILGRTLRMSIRELTMFLFFVGVSVVLFASAIHQAEGAVHKQFQSIPHAFWWAVISLCTVGYGDAVPKTLLGKLIGSACVVAGVMTVALPVPVIVTNFNSVYRRAMLCRRMLHRPELIRRKVVDE